MNCGVESVSCVRGARTCTEERGGGGWSFLEDAKKHNIWDENHLKRIWSPTCFFTPPLYGQTQESKEEQGVDCKSVEVNLEHRHTLLLPLAATKNNKI